MARREERTGTEMNLTLVVGADWVKTFVIYDDADVVVDLTSATLRALVKSNQADLDAAAVATFTVTVTSAAAGAITLQLPDTETDNLTAGTNYWWDLKVTLPAGHASYPSMDDYPLWGTIIAVGRTTRATS